MSRDARWNEIRLPTSIRLWLQGWKIDLNDKSEHGDLWCIKWMKDRYEIIDECCYCLN